MKYWLITLALSLVWVALTLSGMALHTHGEDSFLQQKYSEIAACGFVAIWAFAAFFRIARRAGRPK